MSKSKPFNGHRNWNHWNVSLWINNDEGLYNLARDHVRHSRGKTLAAAAFVHEMHTLDTPKTPDGAPYSLSSVRAAMRDMS